MVHSRDIHYLLHIAKDRTPNINDRMISLFLEQHSRGNDNRRQPLKQLPKKHVTAEVLKTEVDQTEWQTSSVLKYVKTLNSRG
jgi:hypothetical protein